MSCRRGPASLPGRLNSNACNLFGSFTRKSHVRCVCVLLFVTYFESSAESSSVQGTSSLLGLLVGKLENDKLILNNSVGRPVLAIHVETRTQVREGKHCDWSKNSHRNLCHCISCSQNGHRGSNTSTMFLGGRMLYSWYVNMVCKQRCFKHN